MPQPCCAATALAVPLGRRYIGLIRVGGDSQRAVMAHPVDKHFVERANTVLLLTVLWGALAACAIGAMVYDIAHWLNAW